MASSTIVPMASTNANRVSRLILNPAIYRNANVPMRETNILMVGMSVERGFWRNTYTMSTTRMMASSNVLITSWIEASRKFFVLISSTTSTSLGSDSLRDSRYLSMLVMISLALVPAVWLTIQVLPGAPLTAPVYV